MFLDVRCGADPVDHGEKTGGMQRGQDAMPCAAMQVDALRAIGEEGAGGGFWACGHDDKEGMVRHRDEGLRAVGVAFDQIKAVGQSAGFGLEDRQARAAICAEVQRGAIMVPLAEACIDQAEVARGLQNIAEGSEGGGGEGFGLICRMLRLF